MTQGAGGTTAAPASLSPSMIATSERSVNNHPLSATPTPVNNSEVKPITWRSPQEDEENIIEIIEELTSEEPPSRPIKKSLARQQQPCNRSHNDGDRRHLSHQQHQHGSNISSDNNNSDNHSSESYNTAAEARKNNQRQRQQQQLGSKPKLSNMSLLSSAVAHATLERCLLGVNGGETAAPSSPRDDGDTDVIDYSRQCRPGHVIDILELRRLSSRGVPDEPPEVRARAATAPADLSTPPPPRPSTPEQRQRRRQQRHNHPHYAATTGGGSLQNPHRSYRPLVWRVLLGYLPSQTALWNDVLARDRMLYATLVKELFSSTCPAPHDVYGEEELRERRWEAKEELEGNGNEAYRAVDEGRLDKSFAIDDDDEGDDENVPAPPLGTPKAAPPPPAAATTPSTPGLLSARMQQEWVRGEAGGKDSIFHQNESQPGGGRSSPNHMARLSPMCAMNTPRTRIRKEAFRRRSEHNGGDWTEEGRTNDDSLQYSGSIEQSSSALDGDIMDELSKRMKDSLLLPEDDDEEGGEATIEVGGGGGEKEGGASDSPSAKFARSVSISNTTSEEEGVELCRQSSDDKGEEGGDGEGLVSPPTADTDEEENVVLLDEIRKDVIRTHPDLRFFLEPNEDLGQKRYASLERILFVWAKLNKGVRYVQGMNEIVGTLYFVLAHDSNEDWANEAEADTYFLFNSLMVEMRDVFVPDLDEADTGIHGRISNMITLLSLHDPEVRCHLDGVGIDPSFYSVRWLTTLLSREFLLPDTIRLWDSMFASTHKDNFLRYVSVTMVMVIRDQLLSGDFSACLRLLQAYPPTNLDRLLESSRALWIYESQITLACHKGGISLGHALRSIAPPPAIVMAYGLEGGVAPPMREQVRAAGERGLRAARGAVVNGATASSAVASAGRSFFGNAINFWRSGSGGDGEAKNGVRRSKSTM